MFFLPPFRLQGILVVRTQSLFQIHSVGLSLTELSNTVVCTSDNVVKSTK